MNSYKFRRVATCKPGKPGLTSFSETLALFSIQFLLFRKMKVQDRQNGSSGLTEKNGYAPEIIIFPVLVGFCEWKNKKYKSASTQS